MSCLWVGVCVCSELIGLTGSPVSLLVLEATTQSRVVIALLTPQQIYQIHTHTHTHICIYTSYICVYIGYIFVCCHVGWPPKAGNCPMVCVCISLAPQSASGTAHRYQITLVPLCEHCRHLSMPLSMWIEHSPDLLCQLLSSRLHDRSPVRLVWRPIGIVNLLRIAGWDLAKRQISWGTSPY